MAAFAVWAFWMQMVLLQVARSFTPPIDSYEDLAERVLGPAGKFMLAWWSCHT